MNFDIRVEVGKPVKLLTSGKYCDKDILVAADGYTEKDLQAKREEGATEGYNNGFTDGEDAGYSKGYQVGWDEGYGFGQMDAGGVGLDELFDNGAKVDYENDTLNPPELYGFSGSRFRGVYLPEFTGTVGEDAFYACPNLEVVDLGYCTRIEARAFKDCSSLKAVILRSENVVELADVNAFFEWSNEYDDEGMLIPGTRCIEVYIPEALNNGIEYGMATNWYPLNDGIEVTGCVVFRDLEGSEYE